MLNHLQCLPKLHHFNLYSYHFLAFELVSNSLNPSSSVIMASRCIARSCSALATSTPSSAARTFLQLAPQRNLHTSSPVLDFLFPSIPFPALRLRKTTGPLSSRQHIAARRTFTSSSRRQATTAIYNPRDDDDGVPMHIEITPRASTVRSNHSRIQKMC